MRLGRATRNRGDFTASLAAYDELARLGDTPAAGIPAGLIALEGRSMTSAATGNREDERRALLEITKEVDAGRWLLPRATAEFYRDLAPSEPRPHCWTLATSIASVWETEVNGHAAASGVRVVDAAGKPVLVMWRSNGRRSALLAAFSESFLARRSPPAVAFQLLDSSGKRVAGPPVVPPQSVARVIEQASSPWVLRVWGEDTTASREVRSEHRLLAATLRLLINNGGGPDPRLVKQSWEKSFDQR